MTVMKPGISLIMPTYNQGAFIARAIASLRLQKYPDWELIIINDASTDYTEDFVKELEPDDRFRYYKNEVNRGLGYCLNLGMQYASYDHIGYLPSDDIFYADHLSSLYKKITGPEQAVLCYSGLNYGNTDNFAEGLLQKSANGIIPGYPLQLVQVLHRKTGCRWLQREQLVTSDLNKMFWDALSTEGQFVGTGTVSCEWVSHPLQRHKLMAAAHGGGIARYKRHYQVTTPIRFESSDGRYIDEGAEDRPVTTEPVAPDKLKILLVGELGFNPERIVALEAMGHQLYGLWIRNPDIHNSVGPFPFSNLINLNPDGFRDQIKEIRFDIIYALLNHQAVLLAHHVMCANPGIPFVWHFKEGPFFSRNSGVWKELVELFYVADGCIYINQQNKDWYDQFLGDKERPAFILDGDLPSAQWFKTTRSPLLSDADGARHTVMSGRPYGIAPADVATLASYNVHLHLYGEFYHNKWQDWITRINELAGGYLHLHPHCSPDEWVEEYSKYDAGWLHCFNSTNQGELMRCTWDDLNYPARMSTLACAGLPMIQRKNDGHLVATGQLSKELNTGIFFDSFHDLGQQLGDREKMKLLRDSVWDKRAVFSFDHHARDLVDFFKKVIALKRLQCL